MAAVTELAVTRDLRLIPLSAQELSAIVERFPAYSGYHIPASTYDKIDHDVQTLGVWTVVVVHSDMAEKMGRDELVDKYGVHPVINCPDIAVGDAMVDACNKISATGDSSGGIVEVVVTGVPVGLGEPVFNKLDGELGRMLGIGAVKGVEVGAGFAVKDMTGIQSNDQISSKDGKVVFDTNQAGGITGGLSSGQPIVTKLAVKPTPTIDKPQHTIDKYTLENKDLAAITRRDPTIVARIWPIAENYTAMVILDMLMAHYG